jgi:two-component system sensor histidine kinase VicK
LALVVSGKSIGVLSVDSVRLNDFDEKAEQYLELMAAQLATAFTLASSIDTLRDADIQKQAHLEAMAHQLIAPLSAIRTNCENLLEGRINAERLKKLLVSIASQSRIASRTASNFGILADLLVGRATDKKMQKSRQNIVRLVIDIARDFQPMAWANEKNIIVLLRGERTVLRDLLAADQNAISVEYDEGALPQVVGNVVENAVKYSDDFTRILINVEDDSNLVRVHVISQGIKLSKEESEKVFEHAYRTDEARKKFPPGTGIGLPIARSIMEAHGGKLFASPTDDKGRTRFTLELPRKKGTEV